MKNSYLLITLLCTFAGFSQTRLISHKSHSGSMATFSTALENSLFDMAESNFGRPEDVIKIVIDSIILLPDNSAVIISSERTVVDFGTPQKIAFNPGRDTIYNHPLLSQQHQKDSITRYLSNTEYPVPVLINYDNDKAKKNSIPAFFSDDNFPDKPMLVFALALLSGILAFVTYYIYKVKNTTSAA